MSEMVRTRVTLPADLLERLQDVAEDRDVSISLIVARAVERFLDALIPVEDL